MPAAIWFGIPALAAYAAAAWLLWRRLPRLRAGEAPDKKLALAIGLLGALLHAMALASDVCCLEGIDLGVLKALSLIHISEPTRPY